MKYQLIRVFAGERGAQGNLSAITLLDKKMPERKVLLSNASAMYKDKNIATTCYITQVGKTHFDVRCFNTDSEIQCCGHGLIAAAKTVFNENKIPNIYLNKNVFAANKAGEVDLSLPRISAKNCELPAWAHNVMTFDRGSLLPNNAAISDKLDGYLLFEFNPHLPLDVFSGLLLDLKTVCENTKRAVVIVQFDVKKHHLYMRYFAPQYGVNEDSATGSVMRFVGDYIMQTYNIAEYQVSQCSKEGGFMKIKCREKDVLISANVRVESF